MKYLSIMGGLVLTLAVAGSAQMVQANCQDRLDNNIYRCQFTFEADPGDSQEVCIAFNSEDPVFGDFDMIIGEGDSLVLGCSCESTKKKFDGSNTFLCTGGSLDDGPFSSATALEGKVTKKGKKIKKGQFVFEFIPIPFVGNSGVFSCKLDPTCLPPA